MWVALLLLLGACSARADGPVLPTLTIVFAKDTYELGEPIDVTMRYTVTGPETIPVAVITYDRSGRIGSYGFRARDDQGQTVRLPWEFWGGVGGGAFGMATVSRQRPFEQKVKLNEWLAFDRPGTYEVTGHSSIVGGIHGPLPTNGPQMLSAPVRLHLVDYDPQRRAQRLAELGETIKSSDERKRHDAYQELGYLLDPRAIPLLVRGVTDQGRNCSFAASAGLRSLRDRAPAEAAILERVKHGRPVPTPDELGTFSWLLGQLDGDIAGKSTGWRPDVEWRKRLGAMLRQRQPRVPDEQVAQYVIEGVGDGLVAGDDVGLWRRMLVHADHLPRGLAERAGSAVARYCAVSSLQRELTRVAEDQWLPGELRGGAMLALHRLGDDRQRDRIVLDVMRPRPEFGRLALSALGNYRGAEVGAALLTLATSQSQNYQVAEAAAQRLLDLSPLVPGPRLAKALRLHPYCPGRDYLLEALALTDADLARTLVREFATQCQPVWVRSSTVMRLAVALDMRDVVGTVFTCGDRDSLEKLLRGMQEAWQEQAWTKDRQPWRGPRPRCQARRDTIARWFPELLDAASQPAGEHGGPSGLAASVLQSITGDSRYRLAHRDEPIEPYWRLWWALNRRRLGR